MDLHYNGRQLTEAGREREKSWHRLAAMAAKEMLTCPSNLRALPETRGLSSNTQASFSKYLVGTLSVQSATMSYLVCKTITQERAQVYLRCQN